MSTLREQIAYIRLAPLTPLHVGSGALLEPLEYVMREENGAPYLYPIDLPAWVEAQENPAELAEFFGSKSLPEIRRRIAKDVDVATFGGPPARVCSQKIFDTYRKELGSERSENQLLISPALKNPLTGSLIIPGSSIKGAIRTTVIDCLDREWGMRLKEGGDAGYTNKLKECLGGISDNAFKNLKVGDFQAGLGESLIFTAEEVRKKDNASTPKNNCETTLSLATTGAPYAVYGKIILGSHDAKKRDVALTVKHDQHGVRAWRLDELMALCTGFYGQRYLKERNDFYGLPHLSRTGEALLSMEQSLLEHSQNSMLLRIGHYSHVECMTVTNHLPKTRKTKDGQWMPFGTTRTLADGVFPFGWARLSVCSEEEYREALAAREARDRVFVEARELRVREALEARERQARARLETESRAEQERLAAEQVKAELEGLSPEERAILRLERGQANENQAVELFCKLDDMKPELVRRAAAALKAFWIAQRKWSKKECTKKQWEKVTKLKGLLGEA